MQADDGRAAHRQDGYSGVGVRHVSVLCGGQWGPAVVVTTFLAKEVGQGEVVGQVSASDRR